MHPLKEKNIEYFYVVIILLFIEYNNLKPSVCHWNLSFIHSSMALQPFVRPWSLLQFRNLFYTDGRPPWTSDQPVTRPLPTHRTTQTQNKLTHRHLCLELDSNPRFQLSSEPLFRNMNYLSITVPVWTLVTIRPSMHMFPKLPFVY
jgi:hypothetical protein